MKPIKNIFSYLTFFAAASVILLSCSSSKDKFVNRSYHNTTTIYNVLYNGNNSLTQAEQIIVDDYNDDFNNVLPVAPFKKGMAAISARGHLQNASEKAAKAVQKHSMNIGGVERNRYMDEAYFLLGKARFYQEKYLPSLEAFNYIKINFRGKESYYKALLWSARVQIELGNYALAEAELREHINNKGFGKKYRSTLYAYFSDVLYREGKFRESAEMMEKAVELEEDIETKSRYSFILAQIYRLDERISSSNRTYDRVIKEGDPYIYVFHAKLAKAENFDPMEDDLDLYTAYLEEMLEEKKNKDNLEKIHYELALLYYKAQYFEKAREELSKSLEYVGNRKFEKAKAYELLGDVYFEESNYMNSADYYDSTLVTLSKSYKNFKLVERKRKRLNDVIKYLKIAEPNDSILRIVGMGNQERIEFFENHIERLKEEERKRIEEQNKLAEQEYDSKSVSLVQGDKSKFYLYNPLTLQHGKSEFEKRWGNRPLQDDWRVLSKSVNTLVSQKNNDGVEQTTQKELKEDDYVNPLYTVDYYLEKIPEDADTLKQMKEDRDFAYYALGLIYNEQYSKYELSANTLEQLLEYEPKEALILPVYYYLYKSYNALSYRSKIEKYKKLILDNYPDSRYAKLILNPEYIREIDKEAVDIKYEALVRHFSNREFRKAISLSDTIISSYPGSDLLVKVELIKARSIGKLGQPEEYKKALEFVMYSFPNENASEAAKKYIAELEKYSRDNFDYTNKDFPRLIMFINKDEDLSALEKRIKYPLWQKKLSSMRSEYDYENDVYVVFGFQNWQAAIDFRSEFMSKGQLNRDLRAKKVEIIAISQHNFNILQRNKKLNSYDEYKIRD